MTDYNDVLQEPLAPTEGLMPRSRAAVFAAAVRRGRERLGISQDVAADRVGVRQQTWSGWEKGISIPPPRRVASIAELLKLDPTKLQQAAGHIPAGIDGPVDDLVVSDDEVTPRLDQLEQRMGDLISLLSRLDDRLGRIEHDLKRRPR